MWVKSRLVFSWRCLVIPYRNVLLQHVAPTSPLFTLQKAQLTFQDGVVDLASDERGHPVVRELFHPDTVVARCPPGHDVILVGFKFAREVSVLASVLAGHHELPVGHDHLQWLVSGVLGCSAESLEGR